MKQTIEIFKVLGESAKHLASQFSSWHAERVPSSEEPQCWEAGQWPVATRHRIQSLVEQLRLHATDPPVAFYDKHVNHWSIAGEFTVGLQPHAIEVMASDAIGLYCLERPHDPRLHALLDEKLEDYEVALELQQFFQLLKTAMMSSRNLCDEAVIVVIREVLNGSTDDRAFIHSSVELAPWLKEICQ